MKQISYLVIMLLCIVVCNCSQISLEKEIPSGLTVIATNNKPYEVKTEYSLKDNGLSLSQRWSLGDIIGIRTHSSGNKQILPFTQFEELYDDGHTATFHCDEAVFDVGTKLYAIYPFNSNSLYDISSQSGRLEDLSNYLLLEGSSTVQEGGISNLSFSSRCVIFRLTKGLMITSTSYSGSIVLSLSGPAVCTQLDCNTIDYYSLPKLETGVVSVSSNVINGILDEDVYMAFLLNAKESFEFTLSTDKGDRYVLARNSVESNRLYRIQDLSAYKNIQFQDALVKSICVGKWDADGDQELSYAEASQITTINSVFHNVDIVYFDEFRFFTGITTLGVLNNTTTGTSTGSFSLCKKLKSIKLPRSLEQLGGMSFNWCPSLVNVDIPSGVETIYYAPFVDCPSIEGFMRDGKNAGRFLYDEVYLKGALQYRSLVSIAVGGITHADIQTGYDVYSVRNLGSRVLTGDNENFTYISLGIRELRIVADYAFSNYSHLKTIITSLEDDSSYAYSSLVSIGEYAFNYSGITSFTIPQSVKTVGKGCFNGCSKLNSLMFEGTSKISQIPSEFCRGCTSLTDLHIPASVTQIGDLAFSGCSSLTKLYLDGATPPTLTGSPFSYTNCTFYVPTSALNAYKTAPGWSSFASRIVGK